MEQLAKGPDAEPADLDLNETRLGQRPSQPGRHVTAHREQDGDRVFVEAREGELHRRQRRRVEPLDVVHGEADRSPGGEQAKGTEERGGHGALVGRRPRRAEEQRSFEGAPLDRR